MHSKLELVEKYFAACSEGDETRMKQFLHPDVTIYDLNHSPVRGLNDVMSFWGKVRKRWDGATWHVDESVVGSESVAVEWSMRGRNEGVAFAFHGSDHYTFMDGQIREIRQYWLFDPKNPGGGLVDYPYDTHQANAD